MHNKKVIPVFIFLLTIYSGLSFAQNINQITDTSNFSKIKNENKDKVLLINFWATWCKPCVEEFPGLLKLYKEYHGKGLNIVFVSLDFKEDIESKLKPFLKKKGVDFPTYHLDINNADKTASIMLYFDKTWGGGIPASFIFDKQGELKFFILGGEEYDFFEEKIKSLM
jgi:thiol-disulfide isomerase/thioredoxin